MKKIMLSLLSCLLVSLSVSARQEYIVPGDTSKVQARHFPYPSIPGALRSIPERTAYLSEHYWDRYDFSDTLLVHCPEVTEQGLVNFLDLLGRLDSLAAAPAIRKFMSDVMKAPPASREYFSGQLEHYLFDPESPMRNGELYLFFLQCRLQYPDLSENRKRLEFQRENLLKNRVGHQATDFVFIDRKGRKGTLYGTKGDYILLYFNDPDCTNCHIATHQLEHLRGLADPRVTVMAVDPDADAAAWKAGHGQMPVQWIDVMSPGGEIIGRSLYFIQALPTLYLLDNNKRVVLKDCSPKELAADLQQILKR
ncbi:MAG: DUF5106 domain-containing protein [Prevotella sp.]|nr:DUF5106 domain-containing protein [Prevotella sp.]MCH3971096.1 DUF5106 domain-containing protein [Prevotella sp.]